MRYWIVLILFLSSCSAQYHLNKAIKKGAELKTVEVVKHDTTYFSDHYFHIDTIYSKETLVEYVPKTKWQTRIEYKYDHKRFRDSLKYYRRMYSDSLNNALKTTKIENKTERKKNNRPVRSLWLLVMCGIIFIIAIILIKTNRL